MKMRLQIVAMERRPNLPFGVAPMLRAQSAQTVDAEVANQDIEVVS